ncbi:Ferric enterobactin transport system permease protein fepG [Kluyvera cryocrescens]|uniref:Ferric enterobactin transport system permease protein fepG n=1 Tax=Kluyvera cryocrescens TaxID=580 RepID=A0A485CJH6_KLUCR|nr:Ferric enterobactin transport system permease protein fepG [Kluyvera cryocrescens]
MTSPSRRLIASCLLLLMACTLLTLLSLRSGAVTLELSQVFAALFGDAPRAIAMVVTEWRLPRVMDGAADWCRARRQRGHLPIVDAQPAGESGRDGLQHRCVERRAGGDGLLRPESHHHLRWPRWPGALSPRCWYGHWRGATASDTFRLIIYRHWHPCDADGGSTPGYCCGHL